VSRGEEFHDGRQTERPRAVIFDMDGTLADVSGIRHLVAGGPQNGYKKDFTAFHEQSVDAPANRQVVNQAQVSHLLGNKNIVVTARGSQWRNHTAMWLALHRVPSDAMYMRKEGDHRPDYEVKSDILDRASRSYDVAHAVDDNPAVLRLWNERGIPTTRVPGWQE
jgi:phosphoglycolate phosphatase-like HAD superfamily hydrolase